MLPEEWPIAASAADRAVDPARPAGRGRLTTVRRDFFLNPAERLTEQERALMTAMLHDLVGNIADEIRAALPSGSAAANDDDNADLVAELSAAGLLDLEELIALLLRRADEERISQGAKARGNHRRARLFQSLVADDDAAVSASAMALILASGRRRDRLGQICVEFDDLDQDTAAELVHAVSAALRRRMLINHDPLAADRHLAAASRTVFERHDPSKRLESWTAALAEALENAGRLDEALLEVAAEEGEAPFLAQALGRRAGIRGRAAWDHLLGGGERLMLLLRMAGISRDVAAGLLVTLSEFVGIADPGEEIARFDALTDQEVQSARDWMKLDPRYRQALAALGNGNGQRTL